ncbi:MAG: PDZ domain-containing protein [Chloroflexi bacterium]|nr:PDZ domain-containing protein [Chloroflexota bacterium]MCL5273355.1 PDZ domain-containing protein [Chloroflexota bacterium]
MERGAKLDSLEKTVPYLGIEWQMQSDSQSPDVDGSVVSVRRVIVDSPAGRAGILAGDIVRSMDGAPLDAVNTLSTLVMARKPGTTVNLTLLRSGKRMLVKVTLGSRELPAYKFKPIESTPLNTRSVDASE